MKKNKTFLWIIAIGILLVLAWQLNWFGLFALQPITINPSTCVNPTLISEKSTLSDTVYESCYPHSWRYPSIQIIYDGKTGNYINTFSGDQKIWGASQSGQSALVRCYKCDSAQIIQDSVKTKVLTDNIIPNPLAQSSSCSSVCVVGQCMGGWECKGNSQCSYYEYTACNNAPTTLSRFCGNDILENGETQSNCCKDAGCPTGYLCKLNSCEKIEEEPQPPEPETCGDGICGTGETQSNCCKDCGCPASQQCIDNVCQQTSYACGNGICDQNETCRSCPLDCGGACECDEGTILYEQCDIGFKENQWAIKQCLNNKWVNLQSGISCFCANNNICKAGYTCQNNICLPDLPKFCTTTSDCGLREFYCDSSSHKCLKCPEYGGPAECVFSEYSCLGANDCFSIQNQDYCINWLCSGNRCIESGKRFENCCNTIADCPIGNYTCESHSCKEILPTPKKPVSILNIIITIVIILGIGIGGYLIYTKTKLFKK